MPGPYPLSLPASFKAQEIRVWKKHIVEESESPFTGQKQNYVYNVQIWMVSIQVVPTKDTSDASDWCDFFDNLEGRRGTFTLDIYPFAPNQSNPTNVTFKALSNELGWRLNKGGIFVFDRIDAMEEM